MAKNRNRPDRRSKFTRNNNTHTAEEATPPTDAVPEWLKTPSTCPNYYPSWLKDVYGSFEEMITIARAHPRVSTEKFLNWTIMTKRACMHMHINSKHIASISNLGIEDTGNIDLVSAVVEKYSEANEEALQESR